MRHKLCCLMCLTFLMFWLSCIAWSQGPNVSYYYNPATELSWAQCYVYQTGGSQQRIPFLPVISSQHAPAGINNYSKNVNVDSSIVFIGNGIVKENVWNIYIGILGEINVEGKFVMFCYDFPDSLEKELKNMVPLSKRISEAVSRKAAGVILFSYQKEYPFLRVSDILNIPVITITKNSALNILLSAGIDGESLFRKWEESGEPPQCRELISKLKLKIKGNFDKVETKNFLFRFRKEVIPEEEMEKLVQMNEKALTFLFTCFKEDKGLTWEKISGVYFRNFDSKIFYTGHWGSGMGSEEGIFMVHKGGVADFGLAVHENTHILTGSNWGVSNSFMGEGVAKYTETLATDKDKNHLQTIRFLKGNKLFPLEKMVTFSSIGGMGGLKTDVAYPASGSFVEFLIEKYSLKLFKDAYILEGRPYGEKEKESSWPKVYGKSIRDLEKEWLYWLTNRYEVDEKYILDHFEKISKEQKVIELDSKMLDMYVGKYELSPDLIVTITKENKHLFIQAHGDKVRIYPESETKFYSKVIDAQITFIKNEKGMVTQLMLHQGGNDMTAKRVDEKR